MSGDDVMCQLCGGPIRGKSYNWNDDARLPMHTSTTRCLSPDPQLFADFMNRNVEYMNRRGPPVLLKPAEGMPA